MSLFDSFKYNYDARVSDNPTALECQHMIRNLIITLEKSAKAYPTSSNAVVAAKMWNGLARCDTPLARMDGPLAARRLARLDELRYLDTNENRSIKNSVCVNVINDTMLNMNHTDMSNLREELCIEVSGDLGVLYPALTLKSRVLHWVGQL